MSNAADDPGHRPPPPRQGDPQPYTGAPHPCYAPPYGGDPYQSDPQPYGGPPYPGGGYTPAPTPDPPPPADQFPGGYPGRPPAQGEKGFLGALFDLNFDHMVTPRLIKGSYLFAVLLSSMVAVVWLIVGFWLFHYGYLLTVFIVLFTPPVWLASLIAVRMSLEFVINQFKITEHLKAIREQREPR